MRDRQTAQFRFTPTEFVGSLADLGTLLPLLVGLIAFNGVRTGPALVQIGLAYILTGLYYRIPVPVQPLKAAAMIAIAGGASLGHVRAAAFWMAGIMLFLAVTKLTGKLNSVFPRYLIHGLQFSLGLMMIRSGAKLVMSFPQGLGEVLRGTAAGLERAHQTLIPSAADFSTAFIMLVLPQIPLTIGNAVLATSDCALKYYGETGRRATPDRLAATIGIGNFAAGLVGGMPMCHGAGGMTAHYCFGARTGGAGVMIGAIMLLFGATASRWAGTLLPAVPAWLLGAVLAYAGARHCLLASTSFRTAPSAAAVLSMGAIGWFHGNLLVALAVALAVKLVWERAPLLRRCRVEPMAGGDS